MRQFFVFILILCLLSACSGGVYDRAYTASGDGNQESELREDEQFTTTDDLNVVIKLGNHEENVKVVARFIDPNGDLLQEVSAEAEGDVGTVVLGVDYEAWEASQAGNQWIVGRYGVEIIVDGEKVDTVYFRVD